MAGIGTFLLRVGVMITLFFLFYWARVLGAADVKLISVLGGFVGMAEGLKIVFLAACIAAIWGGIQLVRRGLLISGISVFFSYISEAARRRRVLPYPVEESHVLPFAVYLFVSFLVWNLVH